MALSLYDQLTQHTGMFSPITPFRHERELAKAVAPAVVGERSQQMLGAHNNASNSLAAQASVMAQALRGKESVETQESRNRGALALDKQKSKDTRDLVMQILKSYGSGDSGSNFLDDMNNADRGARVPGGSSSGELSRATVDDMESSPFSPGGNPTYFAPPQEYNPPDAPAFTKSDRAVGASPDQLEQAKKLAERQRRIKALLGGFMSQDQDSGFDYLQDF